MRKFLLLLISLKTVDVYAQLPVPSTAPEHAMQPINAAPQPAFAQPDPNNSVQNLIHPQSAWAPPPHMCTAAIFNVIEIKMNRTRTISIPLTTSIRYNTLVLQPQSCFVQTYAGDHKNTTVHMSIWTLPYRVMIEPKLVTLFPPTLAFSGLMSTISPTFAHPNYAIIPVGCQTVSCAVGG